MFNFMQILPMFMQFKSNPAQFLAARGMNIPQQYMANPESAARYLMQSSNMSQDSINNFMQMAGQFQSFMGSQNGNGGQNQNGLN